MAGFGVGVFWAPALDLSCGHDGLIEVFISEYIGNEGEPGELKHLSTRRKGHQRDSVSSGERTRTRPVPWMLLPERLGTAGPSG